MTALLNPRAMLALALAIALAFALHIAYRAGKANVRAAWDKERAEQAQAALAESEVRRMKEKALTITNDGITNAHVKEKARLVADSRITADRLREFQAALNSPASEPASASSGLNGTGGLERELLGNCAETLARLGQEADRLESKVVGLQGYVVGVCLATK